MDMPPTRFRVVERGRRLEVIDTATGQPATRRVDPPADATAPPLPGRTAGRRSTRDRDRATANRPPRATGARTITVATRGFYDNKAPRTVTLDPAHPTVARWWPVAAVALVAVLLVAVATLAWSNGLVLMVVAALAFNPKLRERLRTGTTALIDRIADPA